LGCTTCCSCVASGDSGEKSAMLAVAVED
jgi:hypothetical protein